MLDERCQEAKSFLGYEHEHDEGNENDYEIIIATNLTFDIRAEEEVDLDSNSRNSQLLDSQLLKV